nr:hypothetical protein [Clostridium botulinum]
MVLVVGSKPIMSEQPLEVAEITAISNNPKTLVDDLKYLIDNGYKLEKVKGMDMFLHTPQWRLVCCYNEKLYRNP